MNVNYGATSNGVYWLKEGETIDTEEVGLSDERAMMLMSIGKAQHIGEANELFGKAQMPTALPSKDKGRKVTARARKDK